MSDGEGVANPLNLLSAAKRYSEKMRIFALGLGAYNRSFLDNLAKSGRGRADFVFANEDSTKVAQKAQYHARCLEQARKIRHKSDCSFKIVLLLFKIRRFLVFSFSGEI